MAVKWGVIGCGGIAYRRTIPGIQEANHVELVAVMDIDKEATDKVAAEFKVPKKYYTEAELLADPEVQCVYVATPAFAHKQQVIGAAKAGKHVLCEKPLALNLDEAEAMVAACKDAGVFLTEGYMMKFQDLHKKARDIVAGGKLGRIVFGRAQLSCWYPDIPGAWRQDPAKGGGGSFIDMGTHLVDLLEYIMDDEVVEVAAFTDTLAFNYKSEDSSSVILKFKKGAHGFVDAFFSTPDAAGDDVLEIYGTGGSILARHTIGQLPGGEMIAKTVPEGLGYDADQSKGGGDVEAEQIKPEMTNMYAAECDYLSECIMNNKAPRINTGQHGLHIMKVTAAVYQAAKTKKVVEVK